MAPENAARIRPERLDLTPENAAPLAGYAAHLERSPRADHTPRTYLGAVHSYLGWLQQAEADGDPLNDARRDGWAGSGCVSGEIQPEDLVVIVATVSALPSGLNAALPAAHVCRTLR